MTEKYSAFTLKPGASRALSGVLQAGQDVYRRELVLGKLLPVNVDDYRIPTVENTNKLCRLLARALRQERGRGLAGHWTYDLNRHIGLVQAYRAERNRAVIPAQNSGDRLQTPS